MHFLYIYCFYILIRYMYSLVVSFNQNIFSVIFFILFFEFLLNYSFKGNISSDNFVRIPKIKFLLIFYSLDSSGFFYLICRYDILY